MPLSAPVERKKLHTRNIELQGFEREDGLWDIEAHLTDIKTYDVENMYRNGIPAGEPIHEMWLRFTLDETFTIIDCEAATDNHPLEACPQITDAYKQLIGIRVGVGWRRAVNEKIKGRKGCTHISELMQQLATVSFQTMMGRLRKKQTKTTKTDHAENFNNMIINSCHGWADDGKAVKTFFPEYYKAGQ